jgi:hypothetical protein
MNIIGQGVLLLSLASFALVLFDLDSIHVFIPTAYLNQPPVLLFRILLQFMAQLEWVVTGGQMHLVLITLILHTKSIFRELSTIRRKNQLPQKNTTKRRTTSETLRRRHMMSYSKLDDQQLYSLANYFFTVVNQDMDFTVVFILVPGFALDVTSNYMALQMYEELPLYLYIFVCLLVVLVPTIMAMELPKAGESYQAAYNLLSGWKGECRSRRTLRYKRTASFRPIGYTMGGFFTFKLGTVTTFVEALMDYTINSILSF